MAIFSNSTATANTVGKTLPAELLKLTNRVTEIGSLPEVTARIVEVVEDPRATAHDIHDVVRSDPALAAKLLKVVNSAFYGLPAQVASLERAILMLGLNVVKNLALATSLARLLRTEPLSDHFGPRDLWRHCIAVAVCARMIAKTAKSVHLDEAFVAGLVHDMGLIVVQQLIPKKLREVVDRCHERAEFFCAVEREIVGADHQDFGAVLAAKWKFPPGLRNAISYHHEPSALQPEFQKVTATVHIADVLCCQQQHGFWLTSRDREPEDWMLQLISITREQLDAILAELPTRVEEADAIFTL